MRDAFAAESDDDLDLPAVVRRKPSPRSQQKRTSSRQAPRKVGLAERLLVQALNNPGKVAAAVFLTGCAGAITWNALVLQNVRHPAPLFTRHEPAVAAAPMPAAPAPEQQPLPPARPGGEAVEMQAPAPVEPPPAAAAEAVAAPAPRAAAPRSAMTDLIRNNGVPSPAPQRTQQAAAPAPAAAPTRAPTVRDPIAEMIRLGGPVPTPPANVGRSEDIVLSGQRALARLGYGVKVDGAMGPGTRQAIERFEQDRRLPVTGTFSARTVRELSALSGIAVQ